MRNIALLERCRQEGRNAPDTGRFAVCPNCGNLYPSEYADWYCPACLTEGKRFVLFE
jgi:rubrerythrin